MMTDGCLVVVNGMGCHGQADEEGHAGGF